MKAVFFLLSSLTLILFADFAAAKDPDAAPQASTATARKMHALLQDTLLKALQLRDEERGSFSRAKMPSMARRVRVLDDAALRDKEGVGFVQFAIDTARRRGSSDWKKNSVVGCVYVDSGDIYVKRGDTYHSARVLLGKKEPQAPAHVCQAAPSTAALDPITPTAL